MFGALIPKGPYLTVSLLGDGLRLDSVNEFADIHGLDHAFLPPSGGLCGCTPRIAVGAARHYYGSRWVAVGDAAITRLYKDGIGAAFNTSRVAMQTAVASLKQCSSQTEKLPYVSVTHSYSTGHPTNRPALPTYLAN